MQLQRLWRANAWLILTLCFTCFLATTTAATLTNKSQGGTTASSNLYIVLVSIPVLDKVLPLKHLAEALLSRGVRVGFALPENCRQLVSDLNGLEFISLGQIVGKGYRTALTPMSFEDLGVYDSHLNTLHYYASFQRPMYGALLKHFEADRPNLVIVDRYTFAGYDVCHRLLLPYVVNDPQMLYDIDSPPAYIPAPFSDGSIHTTSVLERCVNSYFRLRFRLGIVSVYQEINAVRHDHGLEPIASKHQMHGHALVLVNSVFGLDEARPLAPQFKMVGLLQSPTLQRERAEATSSAARHRRFPAVLLSWLEAPEHVKKRLVYINFQSIGPLSHQLIVSTINSFEYLNIRILWKITSKQRATFDIHIRRKDPIMFIGDEVEDATLLALAPEIALLITAGDYLSVLEALVAGVPIIGIPQSAEQSETLNVVMRAGAGLRLDVETFTESTLSRLVDWMVNRESEIYKTNAQQLGDLIKTGGGVERAVDEVLTVAEFGARHLLPMHNLQPLYKTYLVDVYLIYGIILCGAAIILRTFASIVLSKYQPLTQPDSSEAAESQDDANTEDMAVE
ncbi:hypothetical protein L915_00224 [Plasmopara halstedii]|uniref:Uncharacterized protein n=1 Tax=Plasmopara halstedii TaxID=4781 RepID=A0A0P1B0I2_PLAHL|nr:hypothetical protein L915_00224 [Plasmopara halstedii]CEG47001.1 hypothetical protein L915_00224 [Plasmopara halstedii]|eukprot:XP_024583370.1 hypothetical protein L915_00224 [Plasmopara halstedii]